MMTAADAAIDYSSRGWSVFPLLGKQPRVPWKDWQTKRPSREQIDEWWNKWPEAGVGLALGPVSGVVRLDADGEEAAAKLIEMFGELPLTTLFSTPSGGSGWLFKHEEGLSTEVLWKGPGVHEELRLMCEGSYTVIPPSEHPDGGNYTWVLPPWDAEPVAVPSRMLAALRSARAASAIRDLEAELKLAIPVPDKHLILQAIEHLPEEYVDQYDTWLQVGIALKSVDEHFLEVWEQWSKKSPKFEEGACSRKWSTFATSGTLTGRSLVHWAKLNGWNPPVTHPQTDIGNASRIVDKYKDSMLYCHPWSKWLVWDGARWAEDRTGSAIHNVKALFRELFDEAMGEYVRAVEAVRQSDLAGAEQRKKSAEKMFAHAKASQNGRRIDEALRLAQDDLPVLPEELDKDQWLLNCANGTLELRTRVLRPHKRTDLLTKLCPTAYIRDATCPRWLKFLNEVFDCKQELIAWIKRLLGYCLTGSTTEHILAILWGTGANGKSTLLEALFHILGTDYSGKAPSELLIASKENKHPTILATLFGKRLVSASETSESARLDETRVKELTGDDTVSCRRLYEDFWQFRPTHKILVATNHQPDVRETGNAIWRRLRLVPFLVTFADADQDRTLLDKLREEAPGILAWMVDGCREWLENGLGDVQAVSSATAEYRSEQDRFGVFLDDCYVRDSAAKVKAPELTAKYSVWCRTNRERELTGKAFNRALSDRGIPKDGKWYMGLREL